ncbi:MAG: hypothetical protein ACOH18_05385 [Candidatus Saccharimonadaceae bacterium]
MDPFAVLGYVIAAISAITTAGFYVKNQATKGNLDGKDATIETLTRQRDATNDENVSLRGEVSELKGENRTLKSLATQTPEIIKLTESVTHLSDSMAVGNQQTTKMLSTTVKLLRVLTRQKGKTLEEFSND